MSGIEHPAFITGSDTDLIDMITAYISEHARSLGNHDDVDLTGAAEGDGLLLQGRKWKPGNVATETQVTQAVSNHEGRANPHPVYLTGSEGAAAFDAIGAAAAAEIAVKAYAVAQAALAVADRVKYIEHGASVGVVTPVIGGALSIDFASNWGINPDGDPYWDSDGATAGEEAILTVDSNTGAWVLIQPERTTV